MGKRLDYREVLVPNETPYDSYQEHINRYAFAAKFVKDKIVLDVACGTGYGSSYLKQKGATMVIGGDISPDYIEYARTHYIRNGLYYMLLDAIDLPFASECFDVIVSLETIEHLTDCEAFLSECRRVLNSGGEFVCSTPNKQIFSPHSDVSVPVHVREFYIPEFHDLLARYFTDIKLYGQRFMDPKARIKVQISHLRSRLFSVIPTETKRTIKRVLHITEAPASSIAKLGVEISDDVLDARYAVLPYRKSLFRVPGCTTAVARKQLGLFDTR